MKLALVALLVGCTGDPPADTDTDDTTPAWEAPEGGVITLTTRDDVVLVADYLPADDPDAAAAILLHMNPRAGFDRTDWTADFLTMLSEAGYAVLVLDRRGAGESEGDPVEAVTGEKGRYDVEAAVLQVTGDGYDEVVIVGASNGTTSMIDYAAWAGDEGLPVPERLVYLTGGDYTEENTSMDAVPVLPSLFVYSDREATWSAAYEGLHAEWTHHEIVGAAHGTNMLIEEEAAEVIETVGAFVAR